MREDYIHFYLRKFLKQEGWVLIAGEYPNGSDDELHPLYIKDPVVARDNSPDHRRHSNNKLVPDLVAYKNNEFLIIEMKPSYDENDAVKLEELITKRNTDLRNTLKEHLQRYFPEKSIDLESSTFVPALGFSKRKKYEARNGFRYFVIENEQKITIE